MTKTMNHTNCAHPATKAARRTCRELRRSAAYSDSAARDEIRAAYEAGVDAAIILGMIYAIGLDIDDDADLEEIIASL
jgi:2-phospho-L-lactate guanylyltransferase (CobY/MobA/RfbA family)